jgi:hypothetical protein
MLNHLSSRKERRLNGDMEEPFARLKAALIIALVPTLLVAAMLTLGFFVRGTTLEPGWPRRAAAAASVAYICFVGLILFRARKPGKR